MTPACTQGILQEDRQAVCSVAQLRAVALREGIAGNRTSLCLLIRNFDKIGQLVMRVQFRDIAEQEQVEAIEYYNWRLAGLGGKFIIEMVINMSVFPQGVLR